MIFEQTPEGRELVEAEQHGAHLLFASEIIWAWSQIPDLLYDHMQVIYSFHASIYSSVKKKLRIVLTS